MVGSLHPSVGHPPALLASPGEASGSRGCIFHRPILLGRVGSEQSLEVLEDVTGSSVLRGQACPGEWLPRTKVLSDLQMRTSRCTMGWGLMGLKQKPRSPFPWRACPHPSQT